MSNHALLIASATINPGSEEAFVAWHSKHTTSLFNVPGFISTDLVPPLGTPDAPWTIILIFESGMSLLAWQESPQRMALLTEVIPLLDGGRFSESVSYDPSGKLPSTQVTEVIFSHVKPGMAGHYREWSGRIQIAQAKYPGYRGMYLQPPAGGGDGHWITILRYDSTEHLEAWMDAPERRALLAERRDFIEKEDFMRLATAFPGWVPVDPLTGKGPPNWKTAMLVLLGLFPIVMLEMRFLSPVLKAMGFHASLGTFIGNVISVALTSFLTMPWFVSCFGWWLFPKGNTLAVASRGVVILSTLFAMEVMLLWKLLPW